MLAPRFGDGRDWWFEKLFEPGRQLDALEGDVGALDDKDKTVRAQAARALGRIGPPARGAVPKLTALSRESDLVVSREAQAALESIGP